MKRRKTKRRKTKRTGRLILIAVAVLSFGVAVSYPIQYRMAAERANSSMTELTALHARARLAEGAASTETPAPTQAVFDTPAPADTATAVPAATATAAFTPEPRDPLRPTDEIMAYILNYAFETPTPLPTSTPFVTPLPSPTPDRYARTGALPYDSKEKVVLDESRILPELRDIYRLNHDLVGWITIPETEVDYPVVQSQDREFYLSHDFYGETNNHGQIILDTHCDPYTPSYNLVISGHNMRDGTMFAKLLYYSSQSFWRAHKTLEFDSLMERKQFVVFAAFYSADYDEDEEGFRYSADIRYRQDADQWLGEIRANQVYDTGIDVEFGDEFITLTTCTTQKRKDGRFVLVCRRIREGETFS